MRLATVEAAMTNRSPTTTWLAARGLSYFHWEIIGHDEPMYMTPSPIIPRKAAIGATS